MQTTSAGLTFCFSQVRFSIGPTLTNIKKKPVPHLKLLDISLYINHKSRWFGRCWVKCLGSLSFTLALFFFKFSLLLGRGVLVLLVLRDEVIHVGLGLGKLHLIHTLAGVPVKETFAAEHGRELFGHSLEELLDGGAVANEGGGHLESSRWDVADRRLAVVWNPLDEVAAVLVLNVQHLFVHLILHRVHHETFLVTKTLLLQLLLQQLQHLFVNLSTQSAP